jgi:hypothetical protein
VPLGEENLKEQMQFQSGDENNKSVSNVWLLSLAIKQKILCVFFLCLWRTVDLYMRKLEKKGGSLACISCLYYSWYYLSHVLKLWKPQDDTSNPQFCSTSLWFIYQNKVPQTSRASLKEWIKCCPHFIIFYLFEEGGQINEDGHFTMVPKAVRHLFISSILSFSSLLDNIFDTYNM